MLGIAQRLTIDMTQKEMGVRKKGILSLWNTVHLELIVILLNYYYSRKNPVHDFYQNLMSNLFYLKKFPAVPNFLEEIWRNVQSQISHVADRCTHANSWQMLTFATSFMVSVLKITGKIKSQASLHPAYPFIFFPNCATSNSAFEKTIEKNVYKRERGVENGEYKI